eukprot:1370886-Rhodomonas_salina.1
MSENSLHLRHGGGWKIEEREEKGGGRRRWERRGEGVKVEGGCGDLGVEGEDRGRKRTRMEGHEGRKEESKRKGVRRGGTNDQGARKRGSETRRRRSG